MQYAIVYCGITNSHLSSEHATWPLYISRMTKMSLLKWEGSNQVNTNCTRPPWAKQTSPCQTQEHIGYQAWKQATTSFNPTWHRERQLSRVSLVEEEWSDGTHCSAEHMNQLSVTTKFGMDHNHHLGYCHNLIVFSTSEKCKPTKALHVPPIIYNGQ